VNRDASGPRKAAVALGSSLALALAMSRGVASDLPHLYPWPSEVSSPDFSLTDTRGAARTMRSFRGHVTVVTFGYANCPGPCSLELQKIETALRTLGQRRAAVRVVFVTLDPARDSGGSLDHFVHGFDPAFVALRGTAAQTDAATTRFSVENARVPAGEGYLIDHVIEEFLFDRGGRLRLVGRSDSTVDDLAHGLAELLQTGGSSIASAKK
jgi:protein SCO1/2